MDMETEKQNFNEENEQAKDKIKQLLETLMQGVENSNIPEAQRSEFKGLVEHINSTYAKRLEKWKEILSRQKQFYAKTIEELPEKIRLKELNQNQQAKNLQSKIEALKQENRDLMLTFKAYQNIEKKYHKLQSDYGLLEFKLKSEWR